MLSEARIKFYAYRIIMGLMTIDEVPSKYQDKVKEYLANM